MFPDATNGTAIYADQLGCLKRGQCRHIWHTWSVQVCFPYPGLFRPLAKVGHVSTFLWGFITRELDASDMKYAMFPSDPLRLLDCFCVNPCFRPMWQKYAKVIFSEHLNNSPRNNGSRLPVFAEETCFFVGGEGMSDSLQRHRDSLQRHRDSLQLTSRWAFG